MRPPLLSIAFTCLSACGAEPAAEDVAAPPAAPTAPAIVLHGVDFVHSRGNAVFARGHVATLNYLRQSGDTVASAVAVRFPRDATPDHAVDLSAPTAHGNPLEAQVVGEGGVRVSNALGDRGTTEVAAFDGKQGLAHGDRPVHLLGPGFVSDSPGFRWRAADDWLDLGPGAVVTHGRMP